MNYEIVKKLDEIAKNGHEALTIADAFQKTFAIAENVQKLKQLLTPEIMKPIMLLQGTRLGFKTDKIYPENIVRDILIEATINGVFPVCNQLNIISGNLYITKEGLQHKLKNIEGLSYNVTIGIPKNQTGGAVVDADIEYTYQGNTVKKTVPFAIRVNNGMGADAIAGKAKRKAYNYIFQAITGIAIADGDVSDSEINVTPNKQSKIETELI